MSTQVAQIAEVSDTAKRRQIIEGARQIFMRDGFDGASMNDITKAAGVSKGTVYAYFPSKEALFEALIREDRRIQAEQICRFSADDENVADVLREIARNIVDAVTRPGHMAHLRTVIAASAKFPSIGHAFYEAGPMYGAGRLAAYLDRQVSAGRLSIGDTQRAAFQFIDLCLTRPLKQMLFCVIETPDPAEMAKAIDSAIAMFMAAYGPKKG
ncbi:MAG: TetR/AcrR family transcriptional regulator [Alphaproteobacteria bacterium]|nr:TetR/AcrR family transcriptional regulator [Alphaproteobacteria bacterium]